MNVSSALFVVKQPVWRRRRLRPGLISLHFEHFYICWLIYGFHQTFQSLKLGFDQKLQLFSQRLDVFIKSTSPDVQNFFIWAVLNNLLNLSPLKQKETIVFHNREKKEKINFKIKASKSFNLQLFHLPLDLFSYSSCVLFKNKIFYIKL